MGRVRIDDKGRPPEELLNFMDWCERRGLPDVGFTGTVWWAEGLPPSQWRRMEDAAVAWASELEPYRDRWPAEFVPFDQYVGDVLSQLPIDTADAAAELAAVLNARHVIFAGRCGVSPRRAVTGLAPQWTAPGARHLCSSTSRD
jgi:hypothetical protein